MALEIKVLDYGFVEQLQKLRLAVLELRHRVDPFI
jgi:hypothetical protein